MKRILLLPRKTAGIIDIRKQEYIVLDDITYLEEIQNEMRKKGKIFSDYKFCQFEQTEPIPFFLKIKDKLTNGFAEFEIGRVKFKNIPTDEEEKKRTIEERHLLPLQQKLNDVVAKASYIIAMERLGEKPKEDEISQLKTQKNELKREISKFEYQKYYDEIA